MAITLKPELTIAVTVSDWEAARKWYADKLGLQESWATDEGGWAEFPVPGTGTTLGLARLGEGETPPGPGGVNITFGVEDIAAARSELEAKGVQFLGPTDELPGMVRIATFQDLDGNVMLLAQSLAG